MSPNRKRRWNSDRYPKMITVRVTAEEHAALSERAARARMSASRYLVVAGLRGKPPPLRETLPPTAAERERWQWLLWELHKLGTNVNQLAHATHRARLLGRSGPPLSAIEQAGQRVQLLVRLIQERL